MISIQNADGSLVPVIDYSPGSFGSVTLSLVRQRQKRADIRFFIEQDGQSYRFGTLVLKKLPENTFGEAEIEVEIRVDDMSMVHVAAETGEGLPVRAAFNPRKHDRQAQETLAKPRSKPRPGKRERPVEGALVKTAVRKDLEAAGNPVSVSENRETVQKIPALMVVSLFLFIVSALQLGAYFVFKSLPL